MSSAWVGIACSRSAATPAANIVIRFFMLIVLPVIAQLPEALLGSFLVLLRLKIDSVQQWLAAIKPSDVCKYSPHLGFHCISRASGDMWRKDHIAEPNQRTCRG